MARYHIDTVDFGGRLETDIYLTHGIMFQLNSYVDSVHTDIEDILPPPVKEVLLGFL